MRRLARLLIVLSVALPALAATWKVRVRDQNNDPLPGVVVAIGETHAISNGYGDVTLQDVTIGEHRVDLELSGYSSVKFDACVPIDSYDSGTDTYETTVHMNVAASSCCRIFDCSDAPCEPPDTHPSIRVVDEAGHRLAGAAIHAIGDTQVLTDGSSDVRLTVRGGYATSFIVSAPGYVGRTVEIPCDTDGVVIVWMTRAC